MFDHHLGDARALPRRVDGNEAVHLAVQLDVAQHVAPVGLQRAAVIVQAHAADGRDQPVGDPARQLAAELAVLPIAPPPGDDVAARVELAQKLSDVRRIILQIAVHRHDHVTPRRLDSGAHRRRLAKIETETDDAQFLSPRRVVLQLVEGAVAAAVVDTDDLVRPPELFQLGEELVQQRLDVVLFVEKRNNDGNLRPVHRAGG